jgi:hypothetical protein
MKLIPKKVKIQGKLVNVNESPRGYVSVGQSGHDLNQQQKDEANALKGQEHIEKWQAFMWEAFEKALKKERHRMKGI